MTGSARLVASIFLAMVFSVSQIQTAAAQWSDEQVTQLSRDIFYGPPRLHDAALNILAERAKPDVAATLILAIRYEGANATLISALSKIAGQPITTWNDAMLWQEAHPEIVPHSSYRDIKLEILEGIDPNFLRFLADERSARENMKIRLEEITWGGVPVDGIPSLDNPKLVSAGEASFMRDDDLVFGVAINGDARAYPLRIMGWHEMFNEVIGGVPVALAYCTLCGSGILFETQVDGREKPFVFGSSGFLYRSNKLMFDRETDSLWNQFTGQPVAGPLVNSGIELKIRPVAITSWEQWRAANPATKVLSLDTGYSRNYGSGYVYNDYFASPDLMFPAIVRDESQLKRKDYVFGIREFGIAKAWPVEAFNGRHVINDAIGGRNLVLIGNALTRTVRAYERGDLVFEETGAPDNLMADGIQWRTGEDALVAPDGRRLPRVAGHVAYWFAWDGYMGPVAELYQP